MTQYTILGRLRLMAGLDDDEAREALPLCAAALEQLLPRVKPGCGKDPRLDQAAAAHALCMLLQRGGEDDGVTGFKAGDITVTKRGGGGKDRMDLALRLKQAAFEDARELLRDTGFYVRETAFRRAPPPCGPPPPEEGGLQDA